MTLDVFKEKRLIFKNAVTERLNVASFLKRVANGEELDESQNDEAQRIDQLIGQVIEEIPTLRGRHHSELLEALKSQEYPALAQLFKRTVEGVREKARQVLSGLVELDDLDVPDGFELRPKQGRFLVKLREYFSDEEQERRTGFVKYPTGMGKTILLGLMIRALSRYGGVKSLVLSPTGVINDQNERRIGGLQEKGIVIREAKSLLPEEEVDVTIATYNLTALESGKLDEERRLGRYDVIFLDECHRGFGPKVLGVLRRKYPDSIIIGLSATPYLGIDQDPSKLRSAFHYFEGEIDSISLKEACEDGDLCPIRSMRVKVQTEQLNTDDDTEKKIGRKINPESRAKIIKDIVKDYIPASISLSSELFAEIYADPANPIQAVCAENKVKAEFKVNNGLMMVTFVSEDPRRGNKAVESLRKKLDLDSKRECIIRKEKTLVFCGDRSQAKMAMRALREAGINVEYVDGAMSAPAKEAILNRFRNGEIDCLCNADLLVEGFDDAEIKHVIVKPTMSLWVYEQMIGRGARLNMSDPNKILTIWDLVGQGSRQCTLQGLHELYGEQRERYMNGEILFGPQELVGQGTFSPPEGEKAIGADGYIEGVIEVERVGKVIVPRDKFYYENPETLRKDLEAFATDAGLDDPSELGTSNNGARACCSNGQEMRFDRYWNNASVILELYENSTEAAKHGSEIIKTLIKAAGYEVKEYAVQDESYFRDSLLVRQDLLAYAEKKGTSVDKLRATMDWKLEAVCANGEPVRFKTYCIRAAVAFGLAQGANSAAQKQAPIALRMLLKIAGLSAETEEATPLNKAYFSHPLSVKADLIAYAKEAGIEDPTKLKTNHNETRANCRNGEKNVRWHKYWSNAAVAFGLAETVTSMSAGLFPKALVRLLQIAGYEAQEFEQQDVKYFNSPAKVKQDLLAFTSASGLTSPLELKTSHQRNSAVCASKELVTLETYFKRAAAAYGFAENSVKARGCFHVTMKKLLEVAGYEVKEKIPRNHAYYNNATYVCSDLLAFAKAGGVENPAMLFTTHSGTRAFCSSNLEVTWGSYCRVAAVVFGLAENSRESINKVREAKEMLLRIGGFLAN